MILKISDLIPKLNVAKLIGIDGVPGSGKTTVAKGIAEKLGASLISFDDYLNKKKDGFEKYLAHDNIQKDIKRDMRNDKTIVIEGNLLLKVLKKRSLFASLTSNTLHNYF